MFLWAFSGAECKHCIVQEGLDDVSVVIVGNKADLEDMRVVPEEAAAQVSV